MTDVEYILGAGDREPLENVLARMSGMRAWQPFDPRAMAFTARFSQRLLTDPGVRAWPELAALAHWFRGARLRELADRHPTSDSEGMQIGRGLAFHLAPANVDSVFMYSWLLSLLAGNVNLVRLSQQTSPQTDYLVEVLRAVLAEETGRAVEGRFVLLTYPHNEAVTRVISEAAMLRVAWGGDASVAAIRAVPLRPTATELVFPDRFSAAAFNSAALAALAEDGLKRLAANFYNDVFWFAQQACSSPRLVVFVGSDADTHEARRRFWSALEEEVRRRGFEHDSAVTMARVAATFEYAARGAARPAEPWRAAQLPQRLMLETPLDVGLRALHCGNGLMLEQAVPDLHTLAAQFSDKEQTLTVFGFGRDELASFVLQLPPRAVDRIAAVGEALTFNNVWDGQDLLTAFCRRISLPTAETLSKLP